MYIYDTFLDTWFWIRQGDYPWTYASAPINMWLYYSTGGSPGARWFYTEDGHWQHESMLVT